MVLNVLHKLATRDKQLTEIYDIGVFFVAAHLCRTTPEAISTLFKSAKLKRDINQLIDS